MEQSASPTATAADPRRIMLSLLIAGGVVGFDQVTKALVRSWLVEGEAWPSRDAWFAISRVENSGAAFGILQGATEFLLVVTALGITGMLIYLWRFPPTQPLYFVALSLVLGGAVGNLIDRVMKGSVTDFLDPAYYPAFNVADCGIVVGIGTILVLTYLEDRKR